MQSTLSLFSYLFSQGLGFIILSVALVLFIVWSFNNLYSRKTIVLLVLLILGWLLFGVLPLGSMNLGAYPFTLTTYGPSTGPVLPLKNMLAFFTHVDELEQVDDIARDPNDVPPPIDRTEPAVVDIRLTTQEVVAEIAPDVYLNYWTYDGTVPGPMLRVREGDTIRLTLANDPSSMHHHNIDLHAVTGPHGGGTITNVAPGEEKTATFKALNPGLYVYHCGHPNAANHVIHGMYGMILVEPEEGMPAVDKEFYVMQGEFYTKGGLGNKGLQVVDADAMLEGHPTYVAFNGRVGGAVGTMHAAVGDTVRMYVGNGGVNLVSSFHVIGEIFDRVFREASLTSAPDTDIQTTLVPAGGATVTEFMLQVPGQYVLVDHALSRVDRGAWGTLDVTGPEDPSIYSGAPGISQEHAHTH